MRNGRHSPKALVTSRISRNFVAAGGVFGQRVSLRVFTILISFAWSVAYTKCQRESRSDSPMGGGAQKRSGYPCVVTLHVTLPTELQDAVRQARQRAAATGELLPTPEGPATTPMSADGVEVHPPDSH